MAATTTTGNRVNTLARNTQEQSKNDQVIERSDIQFLNDDK